MTALTGDHGVPTDVILKLFETLNDSDKLTREQLKELTRAITSIVMAMEKQPSLYDVKDDIIDSNDRTTCEASHKEIKEVIYKEVIVVLKDLISKVKLMIAVVCIAFSLTTIAVIIALIFNNIVNTPGVKEIVGGG